MNFRPILSLYRFLAILGVAIAAGTVVAVTFQKQLLMVRSGAFCGLHPDDPRCGDMNPVVYIPDVFAGFVTVVVVVALGALLGVAWELTRRRRPA